MIKIICIFMCLTLIHPVFAYKVYSYDAEGNRVYRTVEQKDFAYYKNAPKRAFIRQPRTKWEITDEMRSKKMTSSQYTHRKNK